MFDLPVDTIFTPIKPVNAIFNYQKIQKERYFLAIDIDKLQPYIESNAIALPNDVQTFDEFREWLKSST